MITTNKKSSQRITDALQYAMRYCPVEDKEKRVEIVMDGIRDFLLDFAEENNIEDPVQFIKDAYNQSLSRCELTCEPHAIFKIKIVDMGLSVRCTNRLRYEDIQTVEELVQCKASDLMPCRNFGKKSLNEIEQWLANNSLFLGMSDDDMLNYHGYNNL